MYEQSLQVLKEAFPTVDPVIIEAILDSHNGQVDACFEPLLRISDPNYKPDPPQRRQSQPREHTPQSEEEVQQPEQQEPLSPEEQMRRDEEFARQLALEDERERVRLYQRQQQQGNQGNQRPPAPERENSQGVLSSFEQELPVIKERMIEAGTAAKNKMMQWYNQMKENTQQSGSSNQNTMPPTNAQYRGLSRDDRDDLLSGDMSALHLSENDVYTRTTGQVFPQRQNASDTSEWDDRLERRRPGQQQQTGPTSNVIEVNPPSRGSPRQRQQYKTSTSIDQLNADEELARRLAYEDSYASPPPMPARPKSQSPPQAVSPIHSPVQTFSESPKGNESPSNRTIEVNPANQDDEPVKPYTISPKPTATTDTPHEPIKADQGNKKDLLDVDDDDIGLVDVDDDDEDDEELEHPKAATKPNEKA